MSSDSQSNLKSLYTKALFLQSQLDTLQASTTQYASTLRSALSAFEECQRFASSISLFSPNETLDDISSADLPYLSIDYHLATLLPRFPLSSTSSGAPDPAPRRQLVSSAQDGYGSFLSRLDDYFLLSPSDRKLHARWTANRDAFTLLSASDPAQRRETKIARFRQEKELKAQLETLEEASKSITVDEDTVRRLRIKELSLHAHLAFHALDMLAQEAAILKRAPAEPVSVAGADEDRRERERRGDGYSERLDAGLRARGNGGRGGPILSPAGKPLQPFTLLDGRREVRDGVFRSGHRLPTMSIDEYLEAERARGGIIEGGGEPEVKEVDEDDLEAADRETEKKREWDEFVEANPRGSGNTLNRG
ncbi:MAG: hypothetical protein MMC23_008164 [Stictis urceolatum]|nr:hypothetical protein [Stictis urceolata]